MGWACRGVGVGGWGGGGWGSNRTGETEVALALVIARWQSSANWEG